MSPARPFELEGAPSDAPFLFPRNMADLSLNPDTLREHLLGQSILATSNQFADEYHDILPGGTHQIADIWAPTNWVHTDITDSTEMAVHQLRFTGDTETTTTAWQHVVYRQGSMSVTHVQVEREAGNITGWLATYDEPGHAPVLTEVRDLVKLRQLETAWQSITDVLNSSEAVFQRESMKSIRKQAESYWGKSRRIGSLTLIEEDDLDHMTHALQLTFPSAVMEPKPIEDDNELSSEAASSRIREIYDYSTAFFQEHADIMPENQGVIFQNITDDYHRVITSKKVSESDTFEWQQTIAQSNKRTVQHITVQAHEVTAWEAEYDAQGTITSVRDLSVQKSLELWDEMHDAVNSSSAIEFRAEFRQMKERLALDIRRFKRTGKTKVSYPEGYFNEKLTAGNYATENNNVTTSVEVKLAPDRKKVELEKRQKRLAQIGLMTGKLITRPNIL